MARKTNPMLLVEIIEPGASTLSEHLLAFLWYPQNGLRETQIEVI